MKTKCYMIVFLLFCLTTLTSCNSLQNMIVASTKTALSDLEKKQDDMEKRHAKEKEDAINALSQAKDEVIKKQDNQLQSTANSLYGADLAFRAYKQPSRLDTIINNRVIEATTAIKKSPTYEAMRAENERLIRDMDEVKTSLSTLQSEHARVVKEKEQVAKEKDDAVVKETKAKTELVDTKTKHSQESDELKNKIKEKQGEIMAQQEQALAKNKELQAIKTKISTVCGILSLLCLAGVVYSPVFKSKFGIMSSILGLCAVGVWFIEPWMVAVGFGTILVCILGFFAKEHYISDVANDNMVNAIQDIKETSGETYGQVKKSLQEWNTKYKTNANGEVVEVADKTIEKYIDQKLAEYGRLTTKKK